MSGKNTTRSSRWVRLNVGGKVFQTTTDTLSRYPESFLARLINGDLLSDKKKPPVDPTILFKVTVITWAQLGMGWPASRAGGNGRRREFPWAKQIGFATGAGDHRGGQLTNPGADN
ncbi:BTB/POZ domain-containing protein [Ditylenchus destructor]|uniref:BTB/POZ domain-containing protein n=1 Tax=Ditylenchus destructor TaxID=166010 RepID=A0AAD4MNE7_9BILA|nr:BTB/POZ domain-containing protein [Ditylenchus destructor]